MSKHTPGPWKANYLQSGAVCVYDEKFGRICQVAGRGISTTPDNARLIAAAPVVIWQRDEN